MDHFARPTRDEFFYGAKEEMMVTCNVQNHAETASDVRAPARSLDAALVLADGTCFYGQGLGPESIASGELVFTTAMTGYEEALTDPSYRGQMLMFTYPLVGNYGVGAGRAQSESVQPAAVLTATLSESWSERESLRSYLTLNQVPVMHGVDTRAIALWIRRHGAMHGVLSVHRPNLAPSLPV
ncbi:MAG TPA: carbamoyl-phosphate synthase domain-containing protein, partial [Chloroflexota bacterium]